MHARDRYLEDQNHQGTHREHLSQVPAIRVPRLCVGWGTQILLPVLRARGGDLGDTLHSHVTVNAASSSRRRRAAAFSIWTAG